MRKRVFLALLLVVALVLSTSCGLIEKNAEVDQQQVIIEVAGKTYTKAEVLNAAQNVMGYQAYMYSAYGMSYDVTDAKNIADARQSAIDSLIQQAVLNQKEEEYATTTFTEEELAELQTSVDSTYQGYVDSVKSSYFADTTLTGEELDKAIADKMTELGYSTKDTLLDNEKSSKAYDKLKAEVVKDAAVTDEEIQTEYDTQVEAAKTSYASDLGAYGTAVRNGSTVYYRPAGYRYVKNILRKISDDDSSKISDLNTQLTNKQTELNTANTSLAELPEDATTDTEDQQKTREALNATITEATAAVADLQKQLDAAKEAAYAAITPTVDEIVAKLNAGEDFDALMEQYGEDTGMQSEPAKTEGYLVCEGYTGWQTEFTEASMALAKIGDVSFPFRTSYGIHIVKYVSDLAEGAVPLADLKDTISASLLSTKQDDLFNQTVDQWTKDAGAKTYADRLN